MTEVEYGHEHREEIDVDELTATLAATNGRVEAAPNGDEEPAPFALGTVQEHLLLQHLQSGDFGVVCPREIQPTTVEVESLGDHLEIHQRLVGEPGALDRVLVLAENTEPS